MNKHDGFKRGGAGCYKCESCGKLTRETKDNMTKIYCLKCEEIQMHENNHSDNNYSNDDCGDKDCPIKHYTKEQRWWKNDK